MHLKQLSLCHTFFVLPHKLFVFYIEATHLGKGFIHLENVLLK